MFLTKLLMGFCFPAQILSPCNGHPSSIRVAFMPFASETVIISEAFPEPDARHVPSSRSPSVSFGERGIFIGSGGRSSEARPWFCWRLLYVCMQP